MIFIFILNKFIILIKMFEHIKEAARRMTKEQRDEVLSGYNKL